MPDAGGWGMPGGAEERARREEREAQEWLLYREQCNDLRQQLQAAFDLLVERTGQSREQIAEQLAARVAENRASQ
jgi:hypothetical protein